MRPTVCDRCGELAGDDSLLVAPGRVWCSECAVRGGVELLLARCADPRGYVRELSAGGRRGAARVAISEKASGREGIRW